MSTASRLTSDGTTYFNNSGPVKRRWLVFALGFALGFILGALIF